MLDLRYIDRVKWPPVLVRLAAILLVGSACDEPFDPKCNEVSLGEGFQDCDSGRTPEEDEPEDPWDCETYRAKYPPFPTDSDGDGYPLTDHDYAWQIPNAIQEVFYTNMSTNFDYVYTDSESREPADSDDVRGSWDKAQTAWSEAGSPSPDFGLYDSPANERTASSSTDGSNWVWMYDNPVDDLSVGADEFALTECNYVGCAQLECDIALRKYREIGEGPGTGDHVPIVWVTGDTAGPSQMSLTKTFAHEWGHVLGLADFQDPYSGETLAYFPDSVAWPIDMDLFESGGYSWEGLSEDDYAAAVWIYGPM